MNKYVEQVAGKHYGGENVYQHWDFAVDADIPYLHGCATKYLCRWPEKNGKLDLEKAQSYVNKLLVGRSYAERYNGDHHTLIHRAVDCCRTYRVVMYRDETMRELTHAGKAFWNIILSLMQDTREKERELLEDAYDEIEAIIGELQVAALNEQSTSTLAGISASPVPLTEENHYAERAVKRSGAYDMYVGDTVLYKEPDTSRLFKATIEDVLQDGEFSIVYFDFVDGTHKHRTVKWGACHALPQEMQPWL